MTSPEELSPTGDAAPTVVPDVPLEADAADVVEQALDAGTPPHRIDRDLPLEADEADAVEQAEVVPFDDDDRPV